MRALAKTAFCFGAVLSALTLSASPADAQIFGRRTVFVNPPGQVVTTPTQATFVSPAGTTITNSGVVPAGFTATTTTTTPSTMPMPAATTTVTTTPATTMMTPGVTYYPTTYTPGVRTVVGPLGRVRTVYPRRFFRPWRQYYYF
jgi:hypothetical protein